MTLMPDQTTVIADRLATLGGLPHQVRRDLAALTAIEARRAPKPARVSLCTEQEASRDPATPEHRDLHLARPQRGPPMGWL
jgi:hypothetical protein